MGVVGGGASRRSYAFEVALPLAGPLRLPARYRRISLHRADVGACPSLVDPAQCV